MPLSHILWNTQNHKQKCFNSIQHEKFKIKLNVCENKPTKLHSRVVNDDYLWSFRIGIAVTVFLPNFSMTHHAIATQGSIWMTYQQFRALKGVWPKPGIAAPINRSAIFNQKFKAGNLCWASLVESHQGSKEHSQPQDTSPLPVIPKPMSATHSSPLLPATLNISSAMTRFFSFSLPPKPRFHICSLDNLSLPHHCHAGCPWNLTSVAFCAQWSCRPCLTPTTSDRRHADLNSKSWHLRHTGITQVNQGIPCCLPANNRGRNMTSWTTDLCVRIFKRFIMLLQADGQDCFPLLWEGKSHIK